MLGKLFSGGTAVPSAQLPLSFRMPAERSLRLSAEAGFEALPAWRHLSHHIRRYPHDLRAHMQRILLAQNSDLGHCLDGSVLDLFLALGNSGDMLKAHVMRLCADDMGDETKQLLQDMLDNGFADEHRTAWVNGSMLATGDSRKPQKLLTPQRVEVEQNYATLQAEVQDCLEYGQIDRAQELLEQAMMDGQATPELEQELLGIYRHTRNKEGLEKFAIALNGSGAELPEYWINALHESVNW